MKTVRAKLWGRREKNRFASRGFMYCYYYVVVDEDGKVYASDNTADWQKIYKQAAEDVYIINEVLKRTELYGGMVLADA